MFARISKGKIKPGARAELGELCAKLAEQMRELPGVHLWMNFVTSDNELIVIGVYPSHAERQATAAENVRRWASAEHLIEGAPVFVDAEMTQHVRS